MSPVKNCELHFELLGSSRRGGGAGADTWSDISLVLSQCCYIHTSRINAFTRYLHPQHEDGKKARKARELAVMAPKKEYSETARFILSCRTWCEYADGSGGRIRSDTKTPHREKESHS